MNHRRPLQGVALLFVVNGVAFGSWLPRLPELRDRLGLGLGAVGLVLAMVGIGGLAGSALSGWAVGRLGARRVAVWPALALMLLLPAVGFSPTALVLGAVILTAAVADSLADVGMNALAVRAQENRSRSIFTRLHALWSIGSLGGAAVSTGAASAGISLGTQLMALAGAGLAAVVAAIRFIPTTELRPRVRSRPGLTLGIVVVGGAAVLVEAVPHDWSAIFLTDVVGTSPSLAGLGFMCLSVGMVAGRLGGDRVVDRLGPNRSIYLGLTAVTVAVTVTVASPPLPVVLVALTGWGLGVSVVLPLLYRLVGSHHAFGEGSGLAALTVGSRLGLLVGPTAVGSLAAVASLPLAVGVVVGVSLVAAVGLVASGLSD